jgi:hypothetical protein
LSRKTPHHTTAPHCRTPQATPHIHSHNW